MSENKTTKCDKEAKKKEILKYCKKYIDKHGYAPTVREIGAGVGLHSSSSVFHYMDQLYADGSIESEHKSSPRAFRLTTGKKE